MSRLSTGSRRTSTTSVTSRPGSRLSISHPNADLELGDAVIVTSTGLKGIVRYSGPTEFSNGHWIGLELESNSGKNDGSVEGNRYFECKQGHGMFLRAAQLQLVLS
jgi:dynactin complex subunit